MSFKNNTIKLEINNKKDKINPIYITNSWVKKEIIQDIKK